jgi:outer membrane protein
MKKIIFLIIISLSAFSAQAAEVKIGYVDMQKIIMESNHIEKVKTALIKEKVKEIKKLEEELAKQEAILTPETKEKKKAEYEKLMVEYQKMRKASEEELQKNEAELIQKIVLDIKGVLAGIAQEEGYTAILNKAVVIYMPNELDLTDRVIRQFNEILKNNKKTD